MLGDLLEGISFQARESEYIDEDSGVSARLSITSLENLYSSAERRMFINREKKTTARISDLNGVIPSITGKIELVYEGEQEGAYNVALNLIGLAIREQFLQFFPNPEKQKKEDSDPYDAIRAWFADGNTLELENELPDKEYQQKLQSIPGLAKLVEKYKVAKADRFTFMELVLHGLAEFDILNKEVMDQSMSFRDVLANMWRDMGD